MYFLIVCILQFDFFKFITKILLPYQMDYIHIALSYIMNFTDASVIVNGTCQSIPLTSSSSKTIITSTQTGPPISTQSVPAYQTKRSVNRKDDLTITPTKDYFFFCKFLFFNLRFNRKD